MWMLANCKNGVSSYEISRDTKITQKSTWFMLQRIRLASLITFSVGCNSSRIVEYVLVFR